MNLDPTVDLEKPEYFSNGRMFDFINRVAPLHLRIDHRKAMFVKWGHISTGDIAVFVNGRRQHGAAVLTVPTGVIGPSSEKGNAKWGPGDNHNDVTRPLVALPLNLATKTDAIPTATCFVRSVR